MTSADRSIWSDGGAGLASVLTDVVLIFALIGALVFAGSYAVFFAWRRTSAGRSLMYFVLAFLLWALQHGVSIAFPDYLAKAWVELGVYAIIATTIWRLVVVLWSTWGNSRFEVVPRESGEREDGQNRP